MPTRDQAILLVYAIATISGGLGGCTVAAHRLLSGREMRVSFALAYALIGSVFGILTAAYGAVILDFTSAQDIIGPAVLAGSGGAIALSGANITARAVLKRLGVEIVVSVKDTRDGQNDG